MTSAQLVNRIIEKLRTGQVEFLHIAGNGYAIDFRYGSVNYSCEWGGSSELITVGRWNDAGTHTTSDNYSRWIEGMLNGLVRNDDGKLVKP